MSGSDHRSLPLVVLSEAAALDLLTHTSMFDDLRRCLSPSESHEGRLWVRRVSGRSHRLLMVEGRPHTLERIKQHLMPVLFRILGTCASRRSLLPVLIPVVGRPPKKKGHSDTYHTPSGPRHVLCKLAGDAPSVVAQKWYCLGSMISARKPSFFIGWLIDMFPECCDSLPLVGQDASSSSSSSSSSCASSVGLRPDGLLVCVKTLTNDLLEYDDHIDIPMLCVSTYKKVPTAMK
ncbi:unnamed protein product [Vitrella brassicaformis CCMP3155]|uniref:Uncharacterized protein n=1 Tax=Vitrella brassicaformis (strain CCMP3155) TaxID=1169540 RepID=A0A0G4G299_VITBC|nr:unnamed protein product [Vitrella brassicaformis CCMP3155]|eukprot:CEM22110.1 unnamed protein product [Vitrella brassicaformis CCMP3155]